ncbi:hypothetical protein [Hyphomicrobium sp. ghe19]|uniref:hypothetical protein n=1 Tax=Hyphomicrobium sp. ghe19 TaxID=2682968 RepID=UPI001366C00A|nr:hypothetical protein HYPP_01513 [Hyphomicrobium sp. ghe19]
MASVFTNAGKAAAAAALVTANALKYLQWGVGSGQTAASTTVNSTSTTTEARVAGTMSSVTTSVTNDTAQIVGTITAAGSRAITEVGVHDAAGSGSPPTGGNMGLYGDFSVINLASGDSIAFTVKLQFS